jgi:hypothetical protein
MVNPKNWTSPWNILAVKMFLSCLVLYSGAIMLIVVFGVWGCCTMTTGAHGRPGAVGAKKNGDRNRAEMPDLRAILPNPG